MTQRQAIGLTEMLQSRGVPAATVQVADSYGTAYLHGRVMRVCVDLEELPLDLLARPYNGRPGEDVWHEYIMPLGLAQRLAEIVRRAHWQSQVALYIDRNGAGVVCDGCLQTITMSLDRALERL